MKKFFNVILAAVVLLSLYACTDETIGVSITDSVSTIIEDSSFVITGHSLRDARVQMRTSTKMLGALSSEGYGDLTASAVTMWMPAMNIDTTNMKADWIDSCRLKLRIPYTNGYTGNAKAPMRLDVYRLNKSLPSPIYSDFDPTGYYDELLASESYSPTSGWAEVAQSYTSGSLVTDTVRVISVPMPVSLGKELYNAFVSDPVKFSNPRTFADIFPGIYITNSYGSGHVINIQATQFDVYYHKHIVKNDTTEVDSTFSQSYLASTPEVISNNIINFQDIIDDYRASVGNNQSVINSLSLELPVSIPATTYKIQPPEYLLMVKTSKKDAFINGDSLVNNKDSFYAIYDEVDKTYTFSGLRNYILNIINKQGGIATEDDINFTITPVDVTTYVYPTSYSYYYSSSSSSIVTKISPMVSRPAIVELLLDRAKIKISYSSQIVN